MNRQDFLVSTSALAAGLASSAPMRTLSAPVQPHLDFHSDFYVNLHHTLYYQAAVLQSVYMAGADSLPERPARAYKEMLQHVSNERQTPWYRALSYYQTEYGGRSLVFDDEMNALDNALADGVPPSRLKTVLDAVSSIYRETLWPIHDSLNRNRIARWRAELAEFGPSFWPQLSSLYQQSWQSIPYRISVVANTDRFGAFSISGTGDRFWHIVTSSYDHSSAGLSGVEIIAHEASHSIVGPGQGAIGASITKACAALARPEPNDLWHAVIMYMPGVVIQRLAARAGMKYTLAFVDNGVFTRAYPRYYAAFKQHLRPYIEGRATLSEALRATVAEVVAT